MSESTLKQKTIGALLWNLVDRVGQQLLLFVVNVIITNLLSVKDYALIGMLAIFTAIATIIIESGFVSALIRKQDATESDYSSVFYFNVSISVLLYTLLFVSAPSIAAFYNQPQLTDLARIVFLALPLNSLSLIQTTLLNKQVNFKALAKVNIFSLIISSICALTMAYQGWGVWTLAWQPVILAFSRSALLWIFSKWRPMTTFKLSSIKELFGFASGLLLASLINSITTNIYSLVIGKHYSTNEMGYYTQGNKYSVMVISAIYSSLQTATYPIFSSIQDDRERSIRSYRKTMRFTSFLTFPFMIGLVCIAQPFISLILKPEWAGCIPFFQLVCLGGIFTVLNTINQNFAKVQGRSDLIFRLEIVRTGLVIICLLGTLGQSALVMIAFQTVAQIAIYLISIYFIGKAVGYHWLKQLQDIAPYAAISAAMWGVLLIPATYIPTNYILLPTQIIIGILFYYLVNRLLGSTILQEATDLLLKRNKK